MASKPVNVEGPHWYWKSERGIEGPLTSVELRALRRSGALMRGDYIRKGSNGKWVLASRVGGLFQASPSDAQATALAQPESTPNLPEGLGPQPVSIPVDSSNQRKGVWGSLPQFRLLVCGALAASFLLGSVVGGSICWLLIRSGNGTRALASIPDSQRSQQTAVGEGLLPSDEQEASPTLPMTQVPGDGAPGSGDESAVSTAPPPPSSSTENSDLIAQADSTKITVEIHAATEGHGTKKSTVGDVESEVSTVAGSDEVTGSSPKITATDERDADEMTPESILLATIKQREAFELQFAKNEIEELQRMLAAHQTREAEIVLARRQLNDDQLTFQEVSRQLVQSQEKVANLTNLVQMCMVIINDPRAGENQQRQAAIFRDYFAQEVQAAQRYIAQHRNTPAALDGAILKDRNELDAASQQVADLNQKWMERLDLYGTSARLLHQEVVRVSEAWIAEVGLPELLVLRGFSQIHLESYQNAVTDLDEALKKLETVAQSTLSGSDSARLNRLFIACKSGKGWALTRMGKERQGQAVLGEVIGYSNRKASLPYIYRGLSQAAAGAGDRGALNDFDVAMRAEGTEPVAYREAGRIYAHSKTLASPTLALRLSQQACELSGYNDWSSLEVFADALRANDRKADAEKWYQKAFDMAPSEHLPRIHQKLIDEVE